MNRIFTLFNNTYYFIICSIIYIYLKIIINVNMLANIKYNINYCRKYKFSIINIEMNF